MKLPGYDFDIVIIIGNGFDLSIGLKTSYSDFIKSIEFQELLKNENLLAKHLNGIHTLQNWIDIENELKIYSKKFASNNENFFLDYKKLTHALGQYLNGISMPNFNLEMLAVKLIKAVERIPTLIIDFNYTDTVSRISDFLNFDIYNKDSLIHHTKIHGALSSNDIIFGIEDRADISPKHVFLKKSVNKNFNPIDFNKEILKSKNFVVFGHSLGETDHMYFEEYFRKSSTASNSRESQKITVYHYGEDSYYDLFSQIDKLTLKKITKLKQINKVDFQDTKNYS
ncbi:AbiH family protein [Tenacibaculum dicentrarchi]|uniref:AbiH family protein n=1 Tax=Tenacibaculum dicentrarchi TaxID=669041 RepID=UPI000C68224B|nr:conserved hypothetical protein [Tenacibaculum dicentrarchi]